MAVDNSGAASVRFVPDRRLTVAAAAGAVVLVVLAAVADDEPSRLLFLVATVVLALLAMSDLAYSPRLEASAAGVVIRSPVLRTTLTWPQIETVRVDTRIRLGLRSTTLEVDAGETLAVLSRRSIGTDPERAAVAINAFRPIS